MKVDGGKTLTSRGQKDWYGAQFMSRKFEQDDRSYYNYMLKAKKQTAPPESRTALENWVKNVQSSSKWSTRQDDAHSKYMSLYSNEVVPEQHIQNAVQSHQPGAMNNPKVVAD